MNRPVTVSTAMLVFVLGGCSGGAPGESVATTKVDSGWMRLSVDSLPKDSMGVSIRRGRALLAFTNDSLPEYAPSSLKCTSCHLDNATKAGAIPLYGSYGRYPTYLERA